MSVDFNEAVNGFYKLKQAYDEKQHLYVTKLRNETSLNQKDVDKKKTLDTEREEFAAGMEGEITGRNQAFDAFRLTQSYFSDAYLDLADPTDKQMFKDWCLYNMDLLLKSFEEEIQPDLEKPEIVNPILLDFLASL